MKYVIRTFGKNVGKPDNVRNYNCEGLQSVILTWAKAIGDQSIHKAELMVVLETHTKD